MNGETNNRKMEAVRMKDRIKNKLNIASKGEHVFMVCVAFVVVVALMGITGCSGESETCVNPSCDSIDEKNNTFRGAIAPGLGGMTNCLSDDGKSGCNTPLCAQSCLFISGTNKDFGGEVKYWGIDVSYYKDSGACLGCIGNCGEKTEQDCYLGCAGEGCANCVYCNDTGLSCGGCSSDIMLEEMRYYRMAKESE